MSKKRRNAVTQNETTQKTKPYVAEILPDVENTTAIEGVLNEMHSHGYRPIHIRGLVGLRTFIVFERVNNG